MIAGILHTAIDVPDMDRALAFYRDVLDFEVLWDTKFDGEMLENLHATPGAALRAVLLCAGEKRSGDRGTVELIEYLDPDPRAAGQLYPGGRCGHVGFYVKDMPGTYETFKARGVNFNCPPIHVADGTAAGWSVTFFKDPFGNLIELVGIEDLAE